MAPSRILRPTLIPMRFFLLSTLALCALSATASGADEQPSGGSHSQHAAVTAAAATTEFGLAMMQSMARMDAAMQAAPMTGDPDHDFAAMMILHHQGAIDMAEAFLLHGKDPPMRRLAQEIIVTQQQEIEVMRLRLAALQSPAPAGSQSVSSQRVGAPVSSRDRVYTADQTSNTVSVIDPTANKLLGVIRLGDPVPGALSPLYKGLLLVHGMGFSPDHRTLAIVSIGSNSVSLIDTATNRVKGVIYIGRSPHEAFFTPNGREVWATVRGENAVPAGAGLANLMPLGEAGKAAHLTLAAPAGSGSSGHATVSVNVLRALDLLQIAVTGLQPGQAYQVWLVASPAPPYGEKQPLARFKTNVSGAQIVQAVGPLRQMVAPGDGAAAGAERRYLLVTRADGDEPVLTEEPGSVASRP